MITLARDVQLTDVQGGALNKIEKWLLVPVTDAQVFRLFGYAGTGKTTLLRYGLAQWGREIGADTLAATFTGKAALVMTRNGVIAQTIHSLIYLPQQPTEQEIKEFKLKIEKMKIELAGEKNSDLRIKLQIEVTAAEVKLKHMYDPDWTINDDSILRDATLLILDEVSMVNEKMATDLLSFGVKVLVLGDPGQLPPINGAGAFTNQQPDVMLTEIHRQAQENPIIRLSMMAREGKNIPYGIYSDNVMKLSWGDIDPKEFIKADQVITGMNKTRMWLNNIMLRASGYTGPFPTGQGEKIICLKNDRKIGIVNGQFLTFEKIDSIREVHGGCMIARADVTTEDGKNVGMHTIYLGHYLDHVQFDPEREERDTFIKRGMVESTWGYALTVHKAQGSGWGNVIFFDDGMFSRSRNQDDRNRLVYTAITRAENGLLIVA